MSSELRNEDNPSKPNAETERLKEELRVQMDLYLRALADFDNYRKRVERDNAKTIRNGRRDLILFLLEMLDEFDRAFQHAGPGQASVLEGIVVIRRLLENRVQAEGVMPIQSKGERFDPKYHDAVATIAGDEQASGIIVDELRKGYSWGDEVLRPARVVVAQ